MDCLAAHGDQLPSCHVSDAAVSPGQDQCSRNTCIQFGEYLLQKVHGIRNRLDHEESGGQQPWAAKRVELEWIRKDLEARVATARAMEPCLVTESAYLMEDLHSKEVRISALADELDRCQTPSLSHLQGPADQKLETPLTPPIGYCEMRRLKRVQRQVLRQEIRAKEARQQSAREQEAEMDNREEENEALELSQLRNDWAESRRRREQERLDKLSHIEHEWQKLRQRASMRQQEEAQEQVLRREEHLLDAERRHIRAREEQRRIERQRERALDNELLQEMEEADRKAQEEAREQEQLREELANKYESGAITLQQWQIELDKQQEIEELRLQQQLSREVERRRLVDREIRRREHEKLMLMEQEVEAKLLEEQLVRHEREAQEEARRAREAEEDARITKLLLEAEEQDKEFAARSLALEEEHLREVEARYKLRQQMRASRAAKRQRDAEEAAKRLQILAQEELSDEHEAQFDALEMVADMETAEILSPAYSSCETTTQYMDSVSVQCAPSPVISNMSLSSTSSPNQSPFEAIRFNPQSTPSETPAACQAARADTPVAAKAGTPSPTTQDYVKQRKAATWSSPEKKEAYYQYSESIAIPATTPGKGSSPLKERKVRFQVDSLSSATVAALRSHKPTSISITMKNEVEEESLGPWHLQVEARSVRSPTKQPRENANVRQQTSTNRKNEECRKESRPRSPRNRTNSLSNCTDGRSRSPPLRWSGTSRAPSVERRDSSPIPQPQRTIRPAVGGQSAALSRRNTLTNCGFNQKENIPSRKAQPKAKNVVVIDLSNPHQKPLLACLDLPTKAKVTDAPSIIRIPLADKVVAQNPSPRHHSMKLGSKTAPRRDGTQTAPRDCRTPTNNCPPETPKSQVPCWGRERQTPSRCKASTPTVECSRFLSRTDQGIERASPVIPSSQLPADLDTTRIETPGPRYRSLSVPLTHSCRAAQLISHPSHNQEDPIHAPGSARGYGTSETSRTSAPHEFPNVPSTPVRRSPLDTSSSLGSLELSPIPGTASHSSGTSLSSPRELRDLCDGQLVELETPHRASRGGSTEVDSVARWHPHGLNALRAEVMVCNQEMGMIITRVHATPDKEKVFRTAYQTIEDNVFELLGQGDAGAVRTPVRGTAWPLTPRDIQQLPATRYPLLLRALQEMIIAYDMMPSIQQCTSNVVIEVAPNIRWLAAIARVCLRRT